MSGTSVRAEEPEPATTATAMGQLAASMAPGTWAVLPTSNEVPTLSANGLGHAILNFAEDGGWDPVTQQFFFLGSDHQDNPGDDPARFVAYSATTNAWRIMPTPYFVPPDFNNHGYDHNAIDPDHGWFYHRTFSTRFVYRYDIAGGSWSQLPEIPLEVMDYVTCCMGLEYFPELNGLVLAGSAGTGLPHEAYFFSYATNQWSRIADNTPMGDWNHFVEYNPVHHLTLYGGGGGSNAKLYSISATGQVTAHPDAPIPLGVMNAIVTVDPVSGDFIIAGLHGEFYSYDITTETWTSLPGPAPIFSPTREPDIQVWHVIAAPVSTYGVMMFVKFYYEDPVSQAWVYLYKHSPGNTDTTPPTKPTGLDANATGTSSISLSWNPSTDGGSGLADYRVERCQGTGCSSFAQIGTPTTNAFADSGLTSNTSYRYRVRARDAVGNLSGYSNLAGAATASVSGVSGLVAAYGFNENTGASLADSSGNSNTGAITGAAWNTTGKFGNSLTFQGGNDLVLIQPSTSLDLSTGMTLEAWIYPTSLQAAWRPVVQRAPDAYLLHAGSTQSPLRPIGGGTFSGSLTYLTSPSAISVNTWAHVAATWDGTTLREYVNGIQTNTTARGGLLQTTAGGAAAIRIGGNTYNERFLGRIDEVRIYNRALSAAEVSTDMNLPVGSTVSAGPPGVPDGISGAPMTVAKGNPSGSSLTLSWDTSTCAGAASGYHIVYGGGFQLPAAKGGTFATTGTVCTASPPYVWAAPPTTIDPKGLVWWIVTAVDSTGVEGSWGLDGSGAERKGPGPGGSSGACGTTAKSLSNRCGQ